MQLGCEVSRVEEVSDGETEVHFTQGGAAKTLRCSEVIFCTGGASQRGLAHAVVPAMRSRDRT